MTLLRRALAILAMAVSVMGAKAPDAPRAQCRVVQARYAIYVNNDALWVVGSKHFLIAGDDALDKLLEARGWERTVAYGDFTLCAKHMGNLRNLTTNDEIWIRGYANLKFRPRDTRMWL